MADELLHGRDPARISPVPGRQQPAADVPRAPIRPVGHPSDERPQACHHPWPRMSNEPARQDDPLDLKFMGRGLEDALDQFPDDQGAKGFGEHPTPPDSATDEGLQDVLPKLRDSLAARSRIVDFLDLKRPARRVVEATEEARFTVEARQVDQGGLHGAGVRAGPRPEISSPFRSDGRGPSLAIWASRSGPAGMRVGATKFRRSQARWVDDSAFLMKNPTVEGGGFQVAAGGAVNCASSSR